MTLIAPHRLSRRLGVAAAALLALGTVHATPSAAATVPATLTGEVLSSFASDFVLDTQGTCDPDGTSTFTATTEGVAVGPYPGTFTERLTWTIGPQVLEPRPLIPNPAGGGNLTDSRGFDTGPVISFNASFTIDSPVGQVTGTKTLLVTAPGSVGSCADIENGTFPSGFFGSGHLRDVYATVTYDARIVTADGVFHDTGTSQVLFQEFFGLNPRQDAGFSGTNFQETFQSTLLAPTPLFPTSRADCRDEYQRYGLFNNQGDCIAFVSTDGRNEPGQNLPG